MRGRGVLGRLLGRGRGVHGRLLGACSRYLCVFLRRYPELTGRRGMVVGAAEVGQVELADLGELTLCEGRPAGCTAHNSETI